MWNDRAVTAKSTFKFVAHETVPGCYRALPTNRWVSHYNSYKMGLNCFLLLLNSPSGNFWPSGNSLQDGRNWLSKDLGCIPINSANWLHWFASVICSASALLSSLLPKMDITPIVPMYINSGIRISFKAPCLLICVGVVVHMFGPGPHPHRPMPSHSLPWPSDSSQGSPDHCPTFRWSATGTSQPACSGYCCDPAPLHPEGRPCPL